MNFLLLSMGFLLLSSLVAVVPMPNGRMPPMVSVGIALVGAVLGLIPCAGVLAGGPGMTFSAPWQVPFGQFSLHLDSLSAFFLVPVFVLGSLTAVYGVKYLAHSTPEEDQGIAWCCFHLLWLSMVLVFLASNGLLFLMAWEMTVLSSFFLVVLDRNNPASRQAGWLYLTASHLGVGLLIVLFLLLARETGSLEFQAFPGIAGGTPFLKGVLFILAILGFGTKAGFVPLHIWLPEAHPAAPSHVSALMSGVMIKTGVYGLLRILFFLGHPPLWWGWTLLVIGLVSGIMGILFALSQQDLKKLLAYSSVENVGIMCLGFGLGLLGLSLENSTVAVFGFAGGLFHVLNHSIFKGLLFLVSGAILEQTGTRDINQMGGLLKRMPWAGTSFLIGCISIAGFPPFNGFVGEFLIFFGAFLAVLHGSLSLADPALAIIVGLSLIGGLSAACFAKVFSVAFLGNPRTSRTAGAEKVALSMRIPMMILAALCLLIPVGAPFSMEMLGRVIACHPDFPSGLEPAVALSQASVPLLDITLFSFAFIGILMAVIALRNRFQAGREIRQGVTWDCGYARPSASMQYTGSSFSQPLTELFSPVLKNEAHTTGLDFFPKAGAFMTRHADLFQERLFLPAFRLIAGILHRLTWVQNGVVQIYVLYITLTLVILLIVGLM